MKALSYAFRSLAVVSGFLILCGAILISYSAVERTFFDGSFIWDKELAMYILMASVWLGCGPTMFAGRHVSIDILHKVANWRVSRAAYLFSCLMCIVVGSVLTIQGANVTALAIQGSWHSSSLWGPSLVVPYMLVPIGLFLFVVAAVVRLFFPLRSRDEQGS